MREPVTVNGVVLMATPVGEFDKRLVLLTKERGKITAFARGARRSTSPLLAVCNAFVFATFQIYEGRTAYNLYQAEIHYHFTNLAKRIPGVYYGYYFLEFSDYYGREGIDGSAMVNLLYVALRSIENQKIPDELIRYVFELKMLVLNGEYPQVFECVRCGKKENLTAFCFSKGGMLCSECEASVTDVRRISQSMLYTLQYVIASPIEKLYTFTVSDEVLREFASIMTRYVGMYIDKKFKSLEILKMMC